MPLDVLREFVEAERIPAWGMTPLEPLEREGTRLREWLARGLHGGLPYLADSVEVRADPTLPGALRAGALGAILLALPHRRGPAARDENGMLVAGCYRGRNYHSVFRGVLRRLAGRLRRAAPGLALRPFCDVLPVMEKPLAVRAGLGWQGRNTLVLNPTLGSTFVLGGVLIDRPVSPSPRIPDRCGDCRRCLDACPTGALALPGVLDAGRCLARWSTAGLPAPASLPRGPYDRGCDVCQDVCPFNSGPAPEPFSGL
ncbi:MAG: 4Fe-4S binding protein [Deltaproteobacteria bacterium]|nr:4Fe-4S binding protein [Deltaproteobacteria bacterium]